MKNFNEGHRGRLKSKYNKNGIDNLEEHEVLELLLFYVIPRRDTNKLAHTLIDYFGSLEGVLSADKESISKISGCGESTAMFLNLVSNISKKYLKLRWDKKKISFNNSKDVKDMLHTLFINEKKEILYCVFLDNNYNLINTVALLHGQINKVNVDIRKLVEQCVYNNAVHIILAHNHPSGYSNPSKSDIDATLYIKNILKPLSINLINHYVVTDKECTRIL